MTAGVDALLFDLGGVVVEIDFQRVFTAWAGHAGVPASDLRRRFAFDIAYQRHERGEIDAAAYYATLRGALGVSLTDSQLEQGWNAIFVGEVPGVADLLAEIAPRLPLYAFSNSNATHRSYWQLRYQRTLASFRRIFVSCDLGARKPEARAYEQVAAAIGSPPGRILLLDDTEENVLGARRVGMQAVRVRSAAEIAEALATRLN
jgi:glucose-1-phosphatase